MPPFRSTIAYRTIPNTGSATSFQPPTLPRRAGPYLSPVSNWTWQLNSIQNAPLIPR